MGNVCIDIYIYIYIYIYIDSKLGDEDKLSKLIGGTTLYDI